MSTGRHPYEHVFGSTIFLLKRLLTGTTGCSTAAFTEQEKNRKGDEALFLIQRGQSMTHDTIKTECGLCVSQGFDEACFPR